MAINSSLSELLNKAKKMAHDPATFETIMRDENPLNPFIAIRPLFQTFFLVGNGNRAALLTEAIDHLLELIDVEAFGEGPGPYSYENPLAIAYMYEAGRSSSLSRSWHRAGQDAADQRREVMRLEERVAELEAELAKRPPATDQPDQSSSS